MRTADATSAKPLTHTETDKVPQAIALRLGAAAYHATLAWLKDPQNAKRREKG